MKDLPTKGCMVHTLHGGLQLTRPWRIDGIFSQAQQRALGDERLGGQPAAGDEVLLHQVHTPHQVVDVPGVTSDTIGGIE